LAGAVRRENAGDRVVLDSAPIVLDEPLMQTYSTLRRVLALAVCSTAACTAAPEEPFGESLSRQTAAEGATFGSVSLNDLRTNGCMWSGLLDTHPTTPSQDYLQLNMSMLARSNCKILLRAVETWNHIPDFKRISANIATIRASIPNRNYGYSMMIAESIKSRNGDKSAFVHTFAEDGATFDFSKMCVAGTEAFLSGEYDCTPSLKKPEYVAYVTYIMRRAIDAGMNGFMLGNYQNTEDMAAGSSFSVRPVLADARAYARTKGVQIQIGAQAANLPKNSPFFSVLNEFDYIDAPLYMDTNGAIGGDSCKVRTDAIKKMCASINLWNDPEEVSRLNMVLVGLDWFSDPEDDVHLFARMPRSQRASFIRNMYVFFKNHQSGKLGFMMPFLQPGGDNRVDDKLCHGPNFGPFPQWYSANRDYLGGTASISPDPLACADEDAWNSMMNPL
jgi:hypothetical protein